MSDDLTELRDWFRNWGACVADIDYQRARPLFSLDVTAFGTHAAFVVGLDALERDQWSQIWPNITDFEFIIDDLVGHIGGDTAWAATPWSSRGYHADGASFDRPGRATVALRRETGRWLGVHTHFSLRPGTPPQSFGKPRV